MLIHKVAHYVMEIWLHYYGTPKFPIDINVRHDDVVIAPIIHHSQRSLDERSDRWMNAAMFGSSH